MSEARRFGALLLERLVETNALGAVHRAVLRDRQVAVRIIAKSERTDAWLDAMRALQGTNERHLAEIYDVGARGKQCYCVQRWVEGRSLRQLIDDQSLRIDDAIALVRLLLRALDRLHGLGEFHGALCPEHVFIERDEDGRRTLRLTNAGLWRLLPSPLLDEDDPDRCEGLAPHLHYISPEAIQGAPIDGRCDVYGAGMILHELLTGRPPFHGPSASTVLKRHLIESPLAVAILSPGVMLPDGLQAVLDLAHEKDPQRRFGTAAKFARALARFSAAFASIDEGFLPPDLLPLADPLSLSALVTSSSEDALTAAPPLDVLSASPEEGSLEAPADTDVTEPHKGDASPDANTEASPAVAKADTDDVEAQADAKAQTDDAEARADAKAQTDDAEARADEPDSASGSADRTRLAPPPEPMEQDPRERASRTFLIFGVAIALTLFALWFWGRG